MKQSKTLIFVLILVLLCLLVNLQLEGPFPNEPVQSNRAELIPIIQTVGVTQSEPVPEQKPRRKFKIHRKPLPPVRLLKKPPPQAQKSPAPQPPKKGRQPQHTLVKKKKSYPKAKPRVVKKPGQEIPDFPPLPVAMNRTAGKPTPKNGLKVGSELSWNSIPAHGAPMNGHLKITITPKAPGDKPKIKRNLVLLIDVSGSMRLPVESIVTPVILLMNRLGSEDRGVVVAFSNKAKTFRADTSKALYVAGISPLLMARHTDLLIGLRTAVTELRKGQGKGRIDQLVVLTDGITGDGRSFTHEQHCLDYFRQAKIPATILGFGMNCNTSLLTEMARSTGGEFSYVDSVSQLLETVVGDVIGLSGVLTRNNRLVVTLKPGLKVQRGFVLGNGGRELGRMDVVNGKLEIPLGDLKEGETLQVVLEVILPRGETGTVEVAQAQIHYDQPDSSPATSPKTSVNVKYSPKGSKPYRNPGLNNVLSEIRNARKGY